MPGNKHKKWDDHVVLELTADAYCWLLPDQPMCFYIAFGKETGLRLQ